MAKRPNLPNKIARQKKEARKAIVAEEYKKGLSIRKIAEAVKRRLKLEKTPSPNLIFLDIKELLVEWRDYRLGNMDEALQLELERIDMATTELWESWYKSKKDYIALKEKEKAYASDKVQNSMALAEIETEKKKIMKYGDVAFISEIRQQLSERRKLLGLYAPDKKELTGKDGKPLVAEPIKIEVIDRLDKVEKEED